MGQSKAIAVRNRLQRFRIDGSFRIPDCTPNGLCEVQEHATQLSNTLAGYSILVDCTANETVQDYLMREAFKSEIHYCRIQSYHAGCIGEVIVTHPHGPCAACIEERAEALPVYAMSGLSTQEMTISEGCASVTQPASAADLAIISGIAVEGLIRLLTERSLPWNLRYWVGSPIPGADENSIFAHGPQMYDVHVIPQSDTERECPICHTSYKP